MNIFLDASAMVAIMTNEPDAFELERRFDGTGDRLCSALSLWETVRAIARARTIGLSDAQRETKAFAADFALRLVPIGRAEVDVALAAHDLYGKGSGHPAKLNMGDCFAYACAKTNKARLLYKGDDFAKTDLA